MPTVSYKTKLVFASSEDKKSLLDALTLQKEAVNVCSSLHFGAKVNSITAIHETCYRVLSDKFPTLPSQYKISAEREALQFYRSVKSNKHKVKTAPMKKNACVQLDCRTFSTKKDGSFSITTLGKRIRVKPYVFPKLEELMSTRKLLSLKLFVRGDEIWASMPFETPEYPAPKPTDVCCGVDLGVRRLAVTSEGKIFSAPKFGASIRKVRYNKRALQSCGTKSARRHLKKIRRKERNIKRAMLHSLANNIISSTEAKVIVLEDLKGIKQSKKETAPFVKQKRLSHISFAELRQLLTYKALACRKQVVTVNPKYTSQIDSRTGKKKGERKGCRFYGTDGVILDADVNAAINIARRSKHPVSINNYLDGQGSVNNPIVYKSLRVPQGTSRVLQAPIHLG